MKKLNLGCGETKKDGYINVDWQTLTKPDVVHDLNSIPYPFSDNEFDYAEAFHVLEHLDKPFTIMTELHRILKPKARLVIRVPHFSRGFTHAEHSHGFDITFPYYFNKNFTKSGFFGTEYDLEKMTLRWSMSAHLLKNVGFGPITVFGIGILNKIFSFLANLNQPFCSRIWCYWVGGFEEIEYIFTCKK